MAPPANVESMSPNINEVTPTPMTAAATATASPTSASPADSPDISPNRWAPWSRPAAMALSSAGTINRASPKIGHASVTPGEVVGGRTATQHLIDHGHRRIAIIQGEEWMDASRDRLKG